METVTNIASAASRAVFGTPATSNAAGNESAGQEPVAGQLGDVKQGEPYDKGNLETETGDGKEPVAGEKGNVKKGEPFDMGNADSQPGSANESGTKRSENEISGSTTEPMPDAFKGPGPQPVDTKETESGTSKSTPNTEGSKDDTNKATGGKPVNASGVKAEGGDFDAGKSGAGKEAERILAEQGVSQGASTTGTKGSDIGKTTDVEASPAGKKEKVSLKDKIKAKLHKHKD